MWKTCLVCNAIHLEMIDIFRHPRKLDYMLKSLLGVKAQQDDYLCNRCCSDAINVFDSKQKSHPSGLFQLEVLRRDGVVVKDDVDQGDQSEKAVSFDVLEVKIEPKSEALEDDVEDVNDGIPDINYNEMMMPHLESKVKQQRGAVQKYTLVTQTRVGAIADDNLERNSTRLNKIVSSSRLFEEDFNLTILDSNCKQDETREGEYFKREKSVDIDYSTDEGMHISFKYIRSLPNETEFNNTHTGNRPANKKSYVCCQCEKSFSVPSCLKIHERTHTGEKSYKCRECQKGFTKSSNLKTHERIHTGEKPYKCCECKKAFTQSSNLKTHEKIHTGEKPYKCSECEKGFISSQQLKIHEMNHTGEKPYKCCECQKGFTNSCDLKKHERIHTGEKPYKCSECEKSFRTSTQLKIHEMTHTGEKPHKCCKCKKGFIKLYRLKEHIMRIHTGELPYKCSYCSKAFRTQSSHRSHIRMHSNKERKIP